MSTKRYKPEQVVNILRQIEVENANGKTTPQACRDAQITVQTYYRWRKEYGGLKVGQAKRPELSRLMADAHRRKFDAVIVWKFDRFARSVSHLLRALETFKALGIEFVSLSE